MWSGLYKLFGTLALCVLIAFTCTGQQKVKIGAYYFDGWTGTYPYHLTKALKDSFGERQPRWGWMTSTQKVMDKQILEASKAGLSFFSFCWYYNDKEATTGEPLNNALKNFNNSPYANRMLFCLLVANHAGFLIDPGNWQAVATKWLTLFQSENYLMVDRKPLITFFSVKSLVKSFGSVEKVKAAFSSLKNRAILQGFNGVTIAGCVSDDVGVSLAESCGFDILTGYNYHHIALKPIDTSNRVSLKKLQVAEVALWDRLAKKSKLDYLPVSTLNWDPRPWASKSNGYAKAPYYTGFSPKSVEQSVANCVSWINTHPTETSREKIGFLYAWNEYGEGAYLTPTIGGTNYLKHIKKAIGGGQR